MSIVNALLRPFFDALLYPFREMSPLVGLVVVSLLTAIGMLIAFKATSDQRQIAVVKRRIHACLFEIRLFNDDLRAILRAQNEILLHNLTYLRLSLVPMVWIILPLVLIIAQLQFHYAYDGLRPGHKALVKVTLREGQFARAIGSSKPAVTLEAPPGLRIETSPIWIPVSRELSWRIAAERGGDYLLKVRVGATTETKTVRVSSSVARRSPVRHGGDFLDQLLYPAESSLPAASPIRSIAVTYPDREVRILGWNIHWMVIFFVLSILFAFSLKNRFRVTL